MKPITEAMNWRYATQKFDTNKKVSEEEIMKLLDAARLSPSWYGLQPWKFILVENKDIRAQLAEASLYNKTKVIEASHFIVFTSKLDYTEQDVDAYIRSTAKAQGKTVEDLKDFKAALMNFVTSKKETLPIWAASQMHIALGVFVVAAAVEGIDAGPMGGFDREKYTEILGLKELGLAPQVIVAVGYRDETDEALKRGKSRFTLEEVVVRK